MKPRFLLISSLTLLGVALAAALWMRDLSASAAGYESPIHTTLPQGGPTSPLAGQVVVVVAHGLTTSTLQGMPFLSSLARQGATATLALAPNAQVSDILTGACPDLGRPGAAETAPETIFAAVRRISGVSVVAGSREWLALAGTDVADGFLAPSEDDAGDQAVIKRVLSRLDFWLPDLAVVALNAPDIAAAAVSSTTAVVTATLSTTLTTTPGVIGTLTTSPTVTPGVTATVVTTVTVIPRVTATLSTTLTATPGVTTSLSITPTMTSGVTATLSTTPTLTRGVTSTLSTTPTRSTTPTAVPTSTTTLGPATAPATDARLNAIWRMMQARSPGEAALVVMGDTTGAPMVLTGHGVQEGQGGAVTPGDLTLTVAALLGAPFPSSSSGHVEYAMLVMREAQLAEKQVALAQQRLALADQYLMGIGADPTSEIVESDLLVARSALVSRNTDSAYRLASHSLSQADAELAAGRTQRLDRERWSRLPVIALAALPLAYVLISLLAAAVARSSLANALGLAPRRILRRWRPETLIGVVLGAASWLAFRWQSETQPKWPLLLWVLGVGAVVVIAAAAWADHRVTSAAEQRGRKAVDAARVPGTVALCGFGLTFTYLTALLPAWLFYGQGRLVTWFLPDPASVAMLGGSLGLLYVVALLLAPLPWIGALLRGLVGLGAWLWERRRVG